MKKLASFGAVLLLAGFSLSLTGCGGSEGTPNPDLKAPDVPPAAKGSKEKGMQDPSKKTK